MDLWDQVDRWDRVGQWDQEDRWEPVAQWDLADRWEAIWGRAWVLEVDLWA